MRVTLVTLAAAISLTGAVNAETVTPASLSFTDGAIETSLTGVAGDPENGKAVFLDRKLGNCLACHVNADLEDQPFHGEVAPPLDGVADRWSEAELRGIIANPKMMFEGTIMPAFYRDSGFFRVMDSFDGKPILEAQQVEDVLAYLMTLNEE